MVVGRKPERSREYEQILSHLVDCNPHVKWDGARPVGIYFRDPLANFNLDDRDLALLARIPSLRVVSIDFAPNVTDAGMAHLSELRQLGGLWLHFTPIGEKGLAPLADLAQLRSVTLYDTDVTDAGLVHLAKMPRLGTLDLSRSPISNDGLLILAEAPSLRFLTVTIDGDAITEEGAQRLRQEAPRLEVSDDYGPDVSFSPAPPSRILGDNPVLYADWERDRTLVLIAEVTEGRTVAQLVCSLKTEQLDEMHLKPSELEDRGRSLFEAIRGKLPVNVVDWFLQRLPSEQTAAPVTDRELDALLRDGLVVQFRVGCKCGDVISTFRIIK